MSISRLSARCTPILLPRFTGFTITGYRPIAFYLAEQFFLVFLPFRLEKRYTIHNGEAVRTAQFFCFHLVHPQA
ncbi:MAG: hypothetical protein U5K69_29765 [Balneolaceae bacterium]|nr:hypothetical protein [Balneolaceae bacterium]